MKKTKRKDLVMSAPSKRAWLRWFSQRVRKTANWK